MLTRPKKHQKSVARPIPARPKMEKKRVLARPMTRPYMRPPVPHFS